MPVINSELRDILLSNRLNNHADQNKAMTALNAILAAGYNDDPAKQNFRQAVKDHREFWNPLLQALPNRFSIAENANIANDIDFLAHANVFMTDANQNSFAALTRLATAKRAQIALKNATDAQLEAIINQDLNGPENQKEFRLKFFNEQGESLLGEPKAKIHNWDAAQDTILAAAQFPALKVAAQQQLLIQKINANSDLAKLNALIEHRNQNSFNQAVRQLFAPNGPANALVDGMRSNEVYTEAVRHAAAKRALSLFIESKQLFTDEQILANGLGFLNAANIIQNGVFPVPAVNALQDNPPAEYINSLKGTYGARFLPLKAAELRNINDLENIAVSEDPAITQGLLKAIPALTQGGDGAYIDKAVTKKSLPELRQAAALQALKLQITESKDAGLLDSLVKMTNVADLRSVLANSSLGYKDKPKFREAFTDSTNLNSLIALAQIRKNLVFAKEPQHLRELVAAPANQFVAKYNERFSAGANHAVNAVINTHLSDANNLENARKDALLTFAKAEFKKENTNLNNFVNAANPGDVQACAQALLGSNNAADLLADAPDAGISKELRTYAAIEAVIRDTKQPKDLSNPDVKNHLLACINNFTFAAPFTPNPIWQLIASPNAEVPVIEKNRIDAHLVESLVRNTQLARADKLTELAKATDLADFKKKLNDDFAVGNTAWANEHTMEQVQKAACVRLIELNQNHALQYTSQAHPSLMKLIANLPLKKQQALLDNREALAALAAVENKEEIERILGGKKLVSNELIEAVVRESENLNRIAGIANHYIAATLAQMNPPVTVTLKNVEDINKKLFETPSQDLDRNNPNRARNYRIIVLEVVKGRPQVEDQNIQAALNLVENIVINQHRGNEDLRTYYNTASSDEKIIVLKLMSLEKTDTLRSNEITEIIADIKTANTLADFIKLMTGKDYASRFRDPVLEKQLTPQIYEQLKNASRKELLKDPTNYKAELEKQQKELDKLEEKFSQTQLGYFDKDKLERLTELTKVSPFYWFNPGFQASAKKHAAQLGAELKELSELCDGQIVYLNNKLHAIQAQLDNLPSLPSSFSSTNTDMYCDINDRKENLVALKERVLEELGRFNAIQLIFKGNKLTDLHENPIIQEGLLDTINQAKQGEKDLKFSNFTSTSQDYDLSERSKHFEQSWTSQIRVESIENQQGVANYDANPNYLFKVIDAIPENKFREHSVSYKKSVASREDLGSYIEEHTSKSLKPVVRLDGTVDYPPAVKLTANKVMTSKEGKVALAMQMASDLVKTLTCPPTAEKPLLVLGSSDPDFAKYLWTALMIIGEDPNLPFGKDAIRIVSAHVKIDSEFSYMGMMWSSESLHETVFKEHAGLEEMLQGIREVNKKKFGDPKKFEQLAKDTRSLTTSMKDKMFKLVDEDNKEQQKTSRPTLGSGPK